MGTTIDTRPRRGETMRSRLQQPTIDERSRALDLHGWLVRLLPPEWFEPTAEPVGWRCRLCDYSEAHLNPAPPADIDPFDAAWEAGCDAIHHHGLAHHDVEQHDGDRQTEERRRRASYTLVEV